MSAASPTPANDRKASKRGGLVIPHSPRWHQRLAAWLLVSLVRSIAVTLRCRLTDRSGLFSGESRAQPVIFCVWHNRLALSPFAYWKYANPRRARPGIAALVSASKDGAFLSSVFEHFDFQPVRGSSSRRGPQALLELTSWAEKGYDLAITPDGPRGPRYVAQEGVLALAQLTGLPIVPFSYDVKWRIRVNSWDQFIIPLPFSRCEMKAAPALRVPREASDAEREELRLRLEAALRAISSE
jgi:hypothetical protein